VTSARSQGLTRRQLLVAAVAASAAAGCRPSGGPATPGPRPPVLGLFVDESDLWGNLRRAERDIGRKVGCVLVFARVADPVDDRVSRLLDAGYEVNLTLEFWRGRGRRSTYGLADIGRGDLDEHVARWSRWLGRRSRPLSVRVLHEFNGDWYPWSVYRKGTGVADFHRAWRRVASVLRADANGKVALQMCVNSRNAVDAQGRRHPQSLADFWPGPDWVDQVGIDGYNRPQQRSSRSFREIVRPCYEQVRQVAPALPLWISETATTARFGDKAGWLRDMFAAVRTDLPVSCLTYFNADVPDGRIPDDWALRGSAADLAAFRAGASGFR
jgi:hypothetical protein